MNNAAFKEIAGLTDHELAFFVKGRLPYLHESVREEMMQYVRSVRGLSEEEILQLITRKIDAVNWWSARCDRCGSGRLELERYKKSCLLCGYFSTRNELLKLLSQLLAFLD